MWSRCGAFLPHLSLRPNSRGPELAPAVTSPADAGPHCAADPGRRRGFQGVAPETATLSHRRGFQGVAPETATLSHRWGSRGRPLD